MQSEMALLRAELELLKEENDQLIREHNNGSSTNRAETSSGNEEVTECLKFSYRMLSVDLGPNLMPTIDISEFPNLRNLNRSHFNDTKFRW